MLTLTCSLCGQPAATIHPGATTPGWILPLLTPRTLAGHDLAIVCRSCQSPSPDTPKHGTEKEASALPEPRDPRRARTGEVATFPQGFSAPGLGYFVGASLCIGVGIALAAVTVATRLACTV